MDPHIFLDPGSQNFADPKDPGPKHLTVAFPCNGDMVVNIFINKYFFQVVFSLIKFFKQILNLINLAKN